VLLDRSADAQGHWSDVCQHQMGNLRLFRRPKLCSHLPRRVLLLPRDQRKIARRGLSIDLLSEPKLNIQLDVMFAYAYHNKKNATKLSVSNDMPKPGSRDAEAALGNLEMENQGVRSDKPAVVQQA